MASRIAATQAMPLSTAASTAAADEPGLGNPSNGADFTARKPSFTAAFAAAANPAGVRGVAGTTRATRFGRVKDYAKRAHEEICVLVQVETKPALDQLEAICAVDGVDGVFIGPADLHASMGYPGETANPAVLPLIEEAMRRIRKTGKAPGYLSPVEADAKRMLAAGTLFCAVGADVGLLARGAEALRGKFHS